MPAPIGLQLYTVRELLAGNFARTLERIADLGYAGVEPTFDLAGTSPQEAARIFRALGLEVPCAHTPLPIGENRGGVLGFIETLGLEAIAFPGAGPDSVKTLDKIRETCARFNQAQAVAQEHGFAFGIHNHWWEFQEVGDRRVYQVMLEQLHPEIFVELDVYWVQAAGLDPAEVVRELGARVPLLHVKDGPAVRGEPNVAVGDGDLDIPGVVSAAGEHPEWLIVELDQAKTDMMEIVHKSFQYLTEQGLGYGRPSYD
jgi:sugar phosphate isomerase/epimerase